MDKYYVGKKPQLTGIYAVHKEGCPFLHDKEKKIFLGEFTSCNDAVWIARRIFWNSNSCIFCSKESISLKMEAHFEWNMFSVS